MCGTDTDCGCQSEMSSKKDMNLLFKTRPDVAHKWATDYQAPKKEARVNAMKRRLESRGSRR